MKLLHLFVPLLFATFIDPLIWSFQILDIALGLKNLHDFDIIHGDIRAVRPKLSLMIPVIHSTKYFRVTSYAVTGIVA